MRPRIRSTKMRPAAASRAVLPIAAMLAATPPAGAAATAQEVLELPSEDRWVEVDFEEVYRMGSIDGAEWEQFGNVRDVGFDGAGNL